MGLQFLYKKRFFDIKTTKRYYDSGRKVIAVDIRMLMDLVCDSVGRTLRLISIILRHSTFAQNETTLTLQTLTSLTNREYVLLSNAAEQQTVARDRVCYNQRFRAI
jgi:hypothetical protein